MEKPSKNSHHYQVAIVGASIAGATLANQLAILGINTVLLDKSDFPRSKPCGEGLSDLSYKLLSEIGLEEILSSIKKYPLYGYEISQGEDLRILDQSKKDERQSPAVWGLRRHELDNALIESLKDYSNINVLLKSNVRSLKQEKRLYRLQLAKHEITSDYLVLANGGKSKLLGALNIPKLRSKDTMRYGCTFYLEGEFKKSLDRVSIIIEESREIFCTRLAENKLNISFLCTREISQDLREEKSYLSLVKEIARKLSFQPEYIAEPIMTGPCGFQKRPAVFNRTILIGDACEQMDPVGGMGMTHAVISSICAAKALKSCIVDQSNEELAFKTYQRERENLVRPLRGFSRLTFISLVSQKNLYFMKIIRSSFLAKKINKIIHNLDNDNLSSLLARKTLKFIGGCS